MGELSDWLSSLDQRQFDVMKILLEKGLLAFIVGIAGGIFAFVMERYKSALKTGGTFQRINEVLDKSEALYSYGHGTLIELAKQFTSFISWADALYHSPSQIHVSQTSHAKGPEDLQCPVEHQSKGTISIAQLLEDTAPDELVRSVLRRPDFLSEKAHYRSLDGFLYALYEMLKRQPADRRRDVDRSGLITGICYSVFVPLITRPRREYRNHVHSFVLAMMRQLPTDNRKQKRAYMNILNVLPILRGVIDDFPKRDLIKITSEEIPTSDDLIADAHAAILTQIRAILNAV
jgi:hypothetical protein